MKKTGTIFITALIFLLISTASFGQTTTRFEIKRGISLKYDTRTREYKVPITGKNSSLWILASSNIRMGRMDIEILNPNGGVEGEFSVGSETPVKSEKNKNGLVSGSETRETVVGKLEKDFSKPAKGTWIIRLKSLKCTGVINIEFSTHEKVDQKN